MTLTANQIKLSEYDLILVLDASGSMATNDMPGGKSRWHAMQENTLSLAAEMTEIDDDGIDVVVFNGAGINSYTGVTQTKVSEIFAGRSPRSSTPLTEALEEAIGLAGKSAKKDLIVVVTDGVPDDAESTARLLVKTANAQQTDDALTVLFIQIGYDSAATKYLSHLDDGLADAKFDIVDAKSMTEAEKYATWADLMVAAIDD